MSRTNRGSKGPGHEYWSRRPGNRHGGVIGPATKKATHRTERQQSLDYAEIEAALAEQPEVDIHTQTAAAMFGVPEADVTPTMRNKAKSRNYFDLYAKPLL